ncbi:hypothetical protein I7I51_07060 [Histoplasma capsulatum]|uniref:Uncharacterized protein n=1 Tax=Ajellomyces capsulatus TaxID=5037 RepID=A0A8A1MI88_AJECA|nr:hypothetical protein I7I51_07060 [Histoplasma capsulatum]
MPKLSDMVTNPRSTLSHSPASAKAEVLWPGICAYRLALLPDLGRASKDGVVLQRLITAKMGVRIWADPEISFHHPDLKLPKITLIKSYLWIPMHHPRFRAPLDHAEITISVGNPTTIMVQSWCLFGDRKVVGFANTYGLAQSSVKNLRITPTFRKGGKVEGRKGGREERSTMSVSGYEIAVVPSPSFFPNGSEDAESQQSDVCS